MNYIFIVALLIFTQCAWSQERHTNFNPKTDGFNFVNSFNNDFIKELDFRTSGLCGGMVYAALDYYKTRKTIPQQSHRPAVNTKLHDYIYDRQVNSIEHNIDKWAEVGFNPFGARNTEFFNWGLQGFGGGRLQELRESIDRGNPVPLGLWHADGYEGGDHQVLAIGYKMGRYKGDLKDHKEDFEIYVYDPNYPNEKQTLKADPRTQTYYYKDRRDRRWLTYFVDKNYRVRTPPYIDTPVYGSDGQFSNLLLTIRTGNDDLRGGNDNFDVIVHYFNHPSQQFRNVNKSRRWLGNYTQTVELDLKKNVKRGDISHIELLTDFSGGMGGDNWNVDFIRVSALTGEEPLILAEKAGEPLYRFTGKDKLYRLTINEKPVTNIITSIPRVYPNAKGNQCHESVQGKIAWDYKGNKRWAPANLEKLCGNLNKTDQPGKCFHTIMHGGVNWGGGTQWQWKNALELCQGTFNANRTVSCFKNNIKSGKNWSSAIAACKI